MTEKSLNSQQTKSDGTEPVSVEAALESWKEIAAYLQRDVRTVTRWEKSEGLPVHRHLHKSRSSVYAYPSQLDAWRAGRKPSEDVLPGRKWWGPAHAYAIVLIAALSLISVGTGRWVGAVDASGVPAGDEGPQFRQVMLATALPNSGGKLSPDGKNFAFVSQGSLWIAPVHRNDPSFRTGTPVRLTEPMGAWDDGGVAIAWSGDGKWIVFRAIAPGTRDNPASIYLIPSAGGEPQEVSSNENPLNFWRYRIALSPGGEKLYFADGEGIRTRIYETSVGTGERRPLTGVDAMQPAISPDGNWIAFLTFEAPDGQARRLWTMPITGGDPSLLCEALPGGFLRSPVWSPDGSRIALLVKSPDNDLVECTELWMVPMRSDGRNSGTPARYVLRKNTNSLIAGWTAQNEIALLFDEPVASGLYGVPATGGQAVQITDHWSTYPRWSPDGRMIYYRADGDDAYWGLFQIAAEGGSRSEIPFQGEALGIPIPGGGPSLSPDGTRLCFVGVSKGVEGNPFPSAIYVIDSRGGRPIGLTEPGSGGRAPTWSPDGKQIAFTRKSNLFVMPAAGGEPRQISTADDQVEGSTADWSPDGQMIAYLGQDNTLRVIPAAGGPSRILASNVGAVRGRGIAWSPDGQEIAFSAGDRIWKIARSGGELKEIRIGLRGIPGQIGWSHDGKLLAFEFAKGGETELWLMTDLPDPESSQVVPIQLRK